MITSRLSRKSQTTIPQPVRSALHLREGDEIAYEIEGDRVVLRKAAASDQDNPFRTLQEWGSEADQRAYVDL